MGSASDYLIPKEDNPINQTKSQIFRRFLKFGFLAWGGPIAQIAMIRQEIVEEEKWVSNERFNRALAVYQVLPGPEAHELCVFLGMIAGGRWGGFLAGLGFMLPGFLFMLLLTWFYVQFGINSNVIQSVFFGFQVAVVALIFSAVHRIGKHVLINTRLLVIASASFIAFVFGISFLLVLPFAGLTYVLWMKEKTLLTIFMGFLLVATCAYYFTPEIINLHTIESGNISNSISNHKSPIEIFLTGLKAGLLTFGGAYTAIPFIQQDAVVQYGWMSNQQFLDGIALSGILPAPLIIFSTFVGFFGGGWLGAIIITIAIFLPAFCFTLVGHNLMENIIQNKSLHNFLDGITAGVVGLIAFTAIQLFRTTMTDLFTVISFIILLLILHRFKTKFTPAFVIIGSGFISFLISNFTR